MGQAPSTVTVARHAMATRFELLLHGENPVALRAAADAALDEIERLEAQLSLFRPTSEISRVNRHASREPVRVSPPVFRLLQHAQRLSVETQGAFDPTVGPLVECWDFRHGAGRMPAREAIESARACVGMQWVELDERHGTVRFGRGGMQIDLGAIGKGYAIECAAAALREAGIVSALLHAGTSSVYGLGQPPEAPAWKVGVSDHGALSRLAHSPPSALPARDGEAEVLFATVLLRDESLGVSAVWGKHFRAGGRLWGHVLDPRSGEPVQSALLAAVGLPSATETDALSTALLTLGPPGWESMTQLRPGLRALLVHEDRESGSLSVNAQGMEAERR